MNQNYIIMTDSTCDITQDMIDNWGIRILPLEFTVDGKTYYDSDEQLKKSDFYQMLRDGKVAKTAQINEFRYEEMFESILKEGKDILYLAFSSGLSGSYQTSLIAKETMEAKYPERKINIVDTKCASMGEGLLVYLAVKEKEKGMGMEELTGWAEQMKDRICHWVSVDDLMFLRRGGRVSSAQALGGTMLGIKPIIHVDMDGKLQNVAKCRGKEKSLEIIADKLGQFGDPGNKDQTVFISHADDMEGALKVKRMFEEKYGITDIQINYIGPVIGSHTGPGTIALFFVGDKTKI